MPMAGQSPVSLCPLSTLPALREYAVDLFLAPVNTAHNPIRMPYKAILLNYITYFPESIPFFQCTLFCGVPASPQALPA